MKFKWVPYHKIELETSLTWPQFEETFISFASPPAGGINSWLYNKKTKKKYFGLLYEDKTFFIEPKRTIYDIKSGAILLVKGSYNEKANGKCTVTLVLTRHTQRAILIPVLAILVILTAIISYLFHFVFNLTGNHGFDFASKIIWLIPLALGLIVLLPVAPDRYNSKLFLLRFKSTFNAKEYNLKS